MSLANMLTDCKIVKVSNGAGAGTSAQTSTHVDMGMPAANSGAFDSVMFIADLGTVTDNCVLSLKGQDGAKSDDSDQADITSATTGTFTAATSSNTLIILDLVKPQKRYVRAVLGRTTQNAVLNTIIAIQYQAKNRPTVVDASVLLSALIECAG